MPKPTVLVLHSGGLDSTALIHFYSKMNYEVSALFIRFGQASYKKEWSAVKKICKYYQISHTQLLIKAQSYFSDGFIMGRNMMLLSCALTFSNFKKGEIALGIHAGTDYIDCQETFLTLCQKLFTLYTNDKVMIAAPFIHWNKRQIYEYSLQEGIPIEFTYSCELGLKQPCGKCPTCKEIKLLHGSKN